MGSNHLPVQAGLHPRQGLRPEREGVRMITQPKPSDPNRPFDMNRFESFMNTVKQDAKMRAIETRGKSVTLIEMAVDIEKDVAAMVHRVMAMARVSDAMLRNVRKCTNPDEVTVIVQAMRMDELWHTLVMLCHEEISADAAMRRFGGTSQWGVPMWARGPLPRQVIWT